jgi:hypothetical protein
MAPRGSQCHVGDRSAWRGGTCCPCSCHLLMEANTTRGDQLFVQRLMEQGVAKAIGNQRADGPVFLDNAGGCRLLQGSLKLALRQLHNCRSTSSRYSRAVTAATLSSWLVVSSSRDKRLPITSRKPSGMLLRVTA